MPTTERVQPVSAWDTHHWAADDNDVVCWNCDASAWMRAASEDCPAYMARLESRQEQP
jgi:hypothetical protein